MPAPFDRRRFLLALGAATAAGIAFGRPYSAPFSVR
jgi:hypothetical protein